MRYTLAYEGAMTADGRLIMPDALELPTEPIPLRRIPRTEGDGHEGATLIGTVTDVRREVTRYRRHWWSLRRVTVRLITGELSQRIPPGWAPQIDTDSLVFDFIDGETPVMLIRDCRLRAVTLGQSPSWPEFLVTA